MRMLKNRLFLGFVVLSVLVTSASGIDARAQRPQQPIDLGPKSEAGIAVTDFFIKNKIKVEVKANGMFITSFGGKDKPLGGGRVEALWQVDLASLILNFVKSIKSAVRESLPVGRDVLVTGEIKQVDVIFRVLVLVGGRSQPGARGRSVTLGTLEGTPLPANAGIFIAIGGDGNSGADPTDGGHATVKLAGGALAIAVGGRGGDAALASQKNAKNGKDGGQGRVNGGRHGVAVAIGGRGGTGATGTAEAGPGKGGTGGPGIFMGPTVFYAIAMGGAGGTGGDGLKRGTLTRTENDKGGMGGTGDSANGPRGVAKGGRGGHGGSTKGGKGEPGRAEAGRFNFPGDPGEDDVRNAIVDK